MKTENKKLYTTPKMESYEMEPQALLAGSGVEDPDNGIGFGGIDNYGDRDVD